MCKCVCVYICIYISVWSVGVGLGGSVCGRIEDGVMCMCVVGEWIGVIRYLRVKSIIPLPPCMYCN